MKKRFMLFVTVLLIVALFGGSMLLLSGCNKDDSEEGDRETIVTFVKPENDTPYLIKTYADGSPCDEDFKIITFTDTHFNGDKDSAGDAVSLTLIENTIKQEKPDLIVFLGDNCLGPNAAQAIDNLGELFERNNTYWGYVLGNHDGENANGPKRHELPALYGKFEHCVVIPEEGMYGYGNAMVNIKNSEGKVIQTLVFIDSGDYLKEEYCEEYGFKFVSGKGKYDFIKKDQIDWYKRRLREIADKNGSMPNSIMFLHIPLVEYAIGYGIKDNRVYGKRSEKECSSLYNTGMFDAILELGSTKAVVCGHDHTNDYNVLYRGVNLLYSQSSAYNSYIKRNDAALIAKYVNLGKADFNDGHTVFSVNKDGGITITPVLNQDNPSLFDGLSEAHRKELDLDKTLPQ